MTHLKEAVKCPCSDDGTLSWIQKLWFFFATWKGRFNQNVGKHLKSKLYIYIEAKVFENNIYNKLNLWTNLNIFTFF